jgi:glycosyltransferase involved in cell wall biosynthesis
VIPTWNRAHVVCEAIASALDQRAGDQRALDQRPGEVEVIVVDDASTDATVELVKKTFSRRVHVLPLTVQRGPGAARNAGALLACGEYIAFLDSDDVWLPGKLNAELRVFAEFPDANAVVSDSQAFYEGAPETSSRFAQTGLLAATEGRVRLADDIDWLWTNSMNTAHTCGITVRRRVLAQLGRRLFADNLRCCEDWDFQMRLYSLGGIVVLPQVYSWVRRFDDGSRFGRAIPGRPPTRDQELTLVRARLAVIERSKPLIERLRADLAAELERFRLETEEEFARLTVKIRTA